MNKEARSSQRGIGNRAGAWLDCLRSHLILQWHNRSRQWTTNSEAIERFRRTVGLRIRSALRRNPTTSLGGVAAGLIFGCNGFLPICLAAYAAPAPQKSTTLKYHRAQESYILGPGDGLQIELIGIPELSGTFSIGPDGTLYLPRLRSLYVEGLTIDELRYFLTERFRAFVKDANVYIRPIVFRPIRIYIGGEVRRPGYYTLSAVATNPADATAAFAQQTNSSTTGDSNASNRDGTSPGIATVFPTVFDAIRTAQGITSLADLSHVSITRKQSISSGGGRIRANLDFLSLLKDGDESQNIRLLDGDVVSVGKSPVVLRDQLIKASRTNLASPFLQVYVSGRVNTPGGFTVPQGSNLNQAIALAGGAKLLHGKIEFIRLTSDSEIDRRIFAYSSSAASGSYDNPILEPGDIIRVQDNALSASIGLLNELTVPAVGFYSIYSLFKP